MGLYNGKKPSLNFEAVRIMHRRCIMQHGFYVSNTIFFILSDWSVSGIMTSKLFIRESESPRPAASSILISRMTSSSVIIPYIIGFLFINYLNVGYIVLRETDPAALKV